MATVQATSCGVCADDIVGANSVIINPHHPQHVVCPDCAKNHIAPMILAAKEQEFHYPPAYGNIPIDYKNFLHLLPDGFQREYRRKRDEYITPLTQRIYCRNPIFKDPETAKEECGNYLGVQGARDLYRCTTCYLICKTCGKCGNTYPRKESHTCPTTEEDADSNDSFEGLRCPKPTCGLKVELKEACNALRCPKCGTDFCAVCGKEAEHDSNHWTRGLNLGPPPCPRWGKPGARAMYDDEPEPAAAPIPAAPLPVAPPQAAPVEAAPVQPIANPMVGQNPNFRQWIAQEHRERVAEFNTHPLPVGPQVDVELADWRQRAWNGALVRDEAYLVQVLRARFLPQPTLVRDDVSHFNMLLHELLFAIPTLALWRGLGTQVDQDQVVLLRNRLIRTMDGLADIRATISDNYMQESPRIVDMLERTIQKLADLIGDINTILNIAARDEPFAVNFNFQQADVPVVDEALVAFVAHQRHLLEIQRLNFVNNFPDLPQLQENLAVAQDFFQLLESNLRLPAQFVANADLRWVSMVQFFDQTAELDMLHQALREVHGVTQGQALIIDRYDQVAMQFLNLFPRRVLMHYRRGWLPRQRP